MMTWKEGLAASILSLFSMAYKSRCSLPILISVGFMLVDVHMRLELEIGAHVLDQDNPDQQE